MFSMRLMLSGPMSKALSSCEKSMADLACPEEVIRSIGRINFVFDVLAWFMICMAVFVSSFSIKDCPSSYPTASRKVLAKAPPMHM